MKSKDFKGMFVPANIWLHKDLSCEEKLLLMEIDSYNNYGCSESDEAFAAFLKSSDTRVNIMIDRLISLGLVEVFQKNPRILFTAISEKKSKLESLNYNSIPSSDKQDVLESWYKDLVQMASLAFSLTYEDSYNSQIEFNKRIYEGYSIVDFQIMIEKIRKDAWHLETNYSHVTLDFLTNSEKLHKWSKEK